MNLKLFGWVRLPRQLLEFARKLNMKIDGSLANNLQAAIASARRYRGHPVHAETMAFWSELLQHARTLKAAGSEDASTIDPLLAELDAAVAERRATWTRS